MANCSRTTHPTGPQCHHPSIPLPISPPPTPKNLCPFRKLIPPSPRLYRQDHSRGRGLTTTGQPTVSHPTPKFLIAVSLQNQQLTSDDLDGFGIAVAGSCGSGPVGKAIERILELSADAQIRRREIVRNSVAYYTLIETIAAYGKALALLTALQQREEFHTTVGQDEFSECVASG